MGDTKAFPRKKHGRMWKGAHNVTAGKGGAKRPFLSIHENQGEKLSRLHFMWEGMYIYPE